MKEKAKRVFFAIIKSAVNGAPILEEEKAGYSDAIFPLFFSVAKKHDITPMLVFGLQENGLGQSVSENISNEVAKGIYRFESLNYELEEVVRILEEKKITFLPLKGSVIRKYYREPWLRTSCDIDILVKEETIDSAVELLKECGYTVEGKGSHDVSLYAGNGTHIELHYNLAEDYETDACSKILKEKVWEYTIPKKGYTYWREMTDEMFYFYHVAHMAKHFTIGGCGIRPYIDLWLLDGMEGVDTNKRQALLKEGELSKFGEISSALSQVWFEGKPYEKLTEQMEKFILQGGMYGSTENRVALQQQKSGGKFKYALSRIFVPYDLIKFQYPILQKHRYLTPVMQVRRWFRLIFCGRLKHSLNELKYNSDVSNDKAAEITEFLNELGF